MIHLIKSENRDLYATVLAEMHCDRSKYFVEGRGWTDLKVEDGREMDQYDNDEAIYLIGFDTDGSIGASVRLLPAEHGCVLSDWFPHLVSEPDLARKGVFEISRYYASPKCRGPAGFGLRSALHIATLEAAIDAGATRLVGFTDIEIMSLMRYTGWRVWPLGPHAAYAEGVAAAFEVGCTADDLVATRMLLELAGRQLFCAPPWLPRGADVGAIAEMTDLMLNAPASVTHSIMAEMRSGRSSWRPQGDVDGLISRLRRTSVPA